MKFLFVQINLNLHYLKNKYNNSVWSFIDELWKILEFRGKENEIFNIKYQQVGKTSPRGGYSFEIQTPLKWGKLPPPTRGGYSSEIQTFIYDLDPSEGGVVFYYTDELIINYGTIKFTGCEVVYLLIKINLQTIVYNGRDGLDEDLQVSLCLSDLHV